MEYQNKEAEMKYKDLRSRFLGMIIGSAVGEIVARESLVYITPEDEEYERQVAEVSGEEPKAVPKYDSGKNAELLGEACANFLGQKETNGNLFDVCWANQLFFRAAPIAFISEANELDINRTVSMGLEFLAKTHTDPLAVLPAVEWVLLLRSILQKRPEIPNAWSRLETVLKTNTDAKTAWADKSAASAYQSARKKQTKKLSTESGLYMLRFVKQNVLKMSYAKKWQKMPIWKVAMDRLITEGSILNKRDRLTAGAMAGAFLGAYWGIGTISPFYRRRLANQVGYFSRGQSWFDTLAKPLTEVEAEDQQPKDERSSNFFQPHFAHKDQDELKTVFYTLAVKNDALRAKYPGGVATYHQKHSPTANRDICISCFMGGDVDTCIDDLLLCGLMPPDDFLCFDANEGTMWVEAEEIEDKPRDMGVSWLRGRYHDGYLWVNYNGGGRNKQAV
jgi:ADP-ribosylglycohydrolase